LAQRTIGLVAQPPPRQLLQCRSYPRIAILADTLVTIHLTTFERSAGETDKSGDSAPVPEGTAEDFPDQGRRGFEADPVNPGQQLDHLLFTVRLCHRHDVIASGLDSGHLFGEQAMYGEKPTDFFHQVRRQWLTREVSQLFCLLV
jgi:hypothetical protein